MSNEYKDWLQENEAELDHYFNVCWNQWISLPNERYPTWKDFGRYMLRAGYNFKKHEANNP